DQAWWVPLLFAGASLVIVANAGMLRRLLGGRPLPAPAARVVAADGLAFVTAYAFTAYGHTLPNVVAGVLFAWWLARVLSDAPVWLIVYSGAGGAGGARFGPGGAGSGVFP